MAVACHLKIPLPVHQDSREAGLSLNAFSCDDCERVTLSPIRQASKSCIYCHWEKLLPPRVRIRSEAYHAPGKCPDCGVSALRYGVRFLCPDCKGEMQNAAAEECQGCGGLVPAGEWFEHSLECQ